jgi:hypothetical protein
MAGRNLSRFAHLIKVGTTDYKGGKALKSCYSEFFQIRVRLFYKEASPKKRDASFVVKKGDYFHLGKKEGLHPLFTKKGYIFALEFLNPYHIIRYELDTD